MNVLQRQEDIATAICLTDNDRTAYTEILLLDHIFQSIQQTEQRLQWEKECARYCYEQLLFFFSSLTCDCLMLFILLILTRVYLQEYTSYQTHVQHVFSSW
jgi:hypothetical protein